MRGRYEFWNPYFAQLVPRKVYKGVRQPSYPLNYVPTSCDLVGSFPTDKSKRQKVFVKPVNGSFVILHVEPLK